MAIDLLMLMGITSMFKLRTLVLIFAVSSLPSLQAATKVRGQVSDRGTPIPGAIVTISNDGFVRSVTSDRQGRFTFDGVPTGRYEFRTTAEGYAVFERPVTVRSRYVHRNRIDVKHLIAADEQTVAIGELPNRTQLRVGIATGR